MAAPACSSLRAPAAEGHLPLLLPLRAWPVLGILAVSPGCRQPRYVDAFMPEEPVDRVELYVDEGVVELDPAARVRVERTVRGSAGALELVHRLEDGTLVLEAHCRGWLPCSVDTKVALPASVPVSVDLDEGEVWATGLERLSVELNSGTADVEAYRALDVRVGRGRVRAAVARDGAARIAVGDGDVEVHLPDGSWVVDAQGLRTTVDGVRAVRPDDPAGAAAADGRLEIVAPAGSIHVVGTATIASARADSGQ